MRSRSATPRAPRSASLLSSRALRTTTRPATAAEDLLGELLSTARGIDPEGDQPAVAATAATAAWLATNPAQSDAGDHALREGVRLAFQGQPSEPLREWLDQRGVEA